MGMLASVRSMKSSATTEVDYNQYPNWCKWGLVGCSVLTSLMSSGDTTDCREGASPKTASSAPTCRSSDTPRGATPPIASSAPTCRSSDMAKDSNSDEASIGPERARSNTKHKSSKEEQERWFREMGKKKPPRTITVITDFEKLKGVGISYFRDRFRKELPESEKSDSDDSRKVEVVSGWTTEGVSRVNTRKKWILGPAYIRKAIEKIVIRGRTNRGSYVAQVKYRLDSTKAATLKKMFIHPNYLQSQTLPLNETKPTQGREFKFKLRVNDKPEYRVLPNWRSILAQSPKFEKSLGENFLGTFVAKGWIHVAGKGYLPFTNDQGKGTIVTYFDVATV